jgi:FixJ family two-component response regulator
MPNNAIISIVDDDPSVREALKGLLRSMGYAAELFASAVEFLASPHLHDTACLIADVHMPAMSGLELHRRIVSSGHSIPTILMTAHTDDKVRSRALADGITCYLYKPFGDDILLACIHSALQRAGRGFLSA